MITNPLPLLLHVGMCMLPPLSARIANPVIRKRGETETIFNDPSNENKAASEDAVTRAIYTSVVLCTVSIILLVAWWYYGTKRIDRDRLFANRNSPLHVDDVDEVDEVDDVTAVVAQHSTLGSHDPLDGSGAR